MADYLLKRSRRDVIQFGEFDVGILAFVGLIAGGANAQIGGSPVGTAEDTLINGKIFTDFTGRQR